MTTCHPVGYIVGVVYQQRVDMGRPSSRTPEITLEICERIAAGESLRSICKDDHLPHRDTIMRWVLQDETFYDQYARAREAQAHHYADQIIEISDDGENDTYIDEEGNRKTDWDVIARSRLRVDSRKWICARMAPKAFGDRQQLKLDGELKHSHTHEFLDILTSISNKNKDE